MAKHYDKQFKLDAIRYYHDHRELGLQGLRFKLRNQSSDTVSLAERTA